MRIFDVLAFRAYYRFALASDDRAWEAGVCDELAKTFPAVHARLPTLRTTDPNDDETYAFVAAQQPDLVLARCRMLLDQRLFEVPPLGTYVMHPGIVPEYRNSHGCFWALANRDLDRVGMTLLKIDSGVDTGPVYGFYTYDFDELSESHVRIQKRMVLENLDALREMFEAIAAGTADPIDVSNRKSAAWGQPWLTKYMSWKRKARR
jgi:methionyl-tRNA formyltransferase